MAADTTTFVGECDTNAVTALIKQYVPEALLMSDVGSSLIYTLPADNLGVFDQLFRNLDTKLSALHLSGYGVSDNTLDEVSRGIYCRAQQAKQEDLM